MTAFASDPRAASLEAWLQTLSSSGLPFAPPVLLAADASFRRYFRTRRGDCSYVVMDAPPDRETLHPYLQVTALLRELELRAPEILARDLASGLLLLEDLGDLTFSRALQNGIDECSLYLLAGRTLRELQTRWLDAAPDAESRKALPAYSVALLLQELQIFLDWYWPACFGSAPEADVRETFLDVWATTLEALPALPEVLVLRDFHVDNLMLLRHSGPQHDGKPMDPRSPLGTHREDRDLGTDPAPSQAVHRHEFNEHTRLHAAECGLLDFQDAVLGSPAYDLVSLLEDARRDVSETVQEQELERYLSTMPFPQTDFLEHYRVLGVQRTLKIMGIFTRLERRDGKPTYQRHQPRLRRLLMRGLRHPELAGIRAWFSEYVPNEESPCAP